MEGKSPHQSKKNELHNGEETPCLPEEIILEEILARLPVKPLLKFRSNNIYPVESSHKKVEEFASF
ncbi:hypothetical protein ACS0TY_004936 [Phlomoides rotata]